MKKTTFKLERKSAFEFKKTSDSGVKMSIGNPTTTTLTTHPTITFTCKV